MISRGDFGMVGTERLLALLAKFAIPATWFIPGHTIESYPASATAVHEAGHEIGHHGWTHRPPASLGREDEERELVRGNEAIKALTGRNARGYRSPSWDLSEHSIALLLKHGFIYDSSLMGHDYLPYQARDGDVAELQAPMRFGPDTALVEMPISWSLDDYPVFEFSQHAERRAAGADERRAGGRQLAGRLPLHGRSLRVGRDHLHLPPARDRPRPPDGDAGGADRASCGTAARSSSPWSRRWRSTGRGIRTAAASAAPRPSRQARFPDLAGGFSRSLRGACRGEGGATTCAIRGGGTHEG